MFSNKTYVNELSQILDTIEDGVIITCKRMKVISINNTFSNITNYRLNEIVGNSISLFGSSSENGIFKNILKELKYSNFWEGEVSTINKCGKTINFLLRVFAIRDMSGVIKNYVGFISSLKKVSNSDALLLDLLNKDSLTKLPNRFLLLSKLKHLVKEKIEKIFFLITVDIFNIEEINNTHNHILGDKLIYHTSEKLKNLIGEDDYLSRMIGKEFILVKNNIESRKELRDFLTKLSRIKDEEIIIDNKKLYIDLRLGVSIFPNHTKDAENLLKYSKMALIDCKKKENSIFSFYNHRMTKELEKKLQLELEIKNAISNNEFKAYYQPIIDIKTKELIGLEALIRWEHREKGLIYPNSFIAYLESSMYIHEVGEMILKDACSFFKKLNDLGILENGKLSINVSPSQILEFNFLPTLKSVLEETKIKPQTLELEIVERTLLENNSKVIRILNKIKELGIGIVLDDFGTGFSSLSYLKQFPFNKLKVDKVFIDNIHICKKDKSIVKSIISLSEGLGISIVIEGVETYEQEEELKKLSSYLYVQGWLYSKALNKLDFIDYFYNLDNELKL